MLERSIVSLAKDVKQINNKVERIAGVVARSEQHPEGQELSVVKAARMPSLAAVPSSNFADQPAAAAPSAAATLAQGAAVAAEVKAVAAKAAQAATAALKAKLLKEKKRAAEQAKRAAAYKKELAYEQSMPTPTYSYQEQDHTTPFFARGGDAAARSSGCGAMCRLRRLVEKTKGRIDSELRAAMRGGGGH